VPAQVAHLDLRVEVLDEPLDFFAGNGRHRFVADAGEDVVLQTALVIPGARVPLGLAGRNPTAAPVAHGFETAEGDPALLGEEATEAVLLLLRLGRVGAGLLPVETERLGDVDPLARSVSEPDFPAEVDSPGRIDERFERARTGFRHDVSVPFYPTFRRGDAPG